MKSVRALRSLRPLRMVHKIPILKISINATASAIPASLRVIMIEFIFVSVFAILGIQLFSGGFAACSDGCILSRNYCVVDSLFDPELHPRGAGASCEDEKTVRAGLNVIGTQNPQFGWVVPG